MHIENKIPMYVVTAKRNMKDEAVIIISALLGTGGIATTIISWLLSRKKTNIDIRQSITEAAASITETNKNLLVSLNSRILALESDVTMLTAQNKILTEQNTALLRRLSEIGDLVLKTSGDNVAKADIARLLK